MNTLNPTFFAEIGRTKQLIQHVNKPRKRHE